MKKLITLIAAIIFTTVLYGQTVQNVASSVNPLAAVYESYFALKDALVKSNGQSAQQTAGLLFDGIAAVSMEQLSPEQHEVWMKYMQKLSDDAGQIKKSDKVDKQRKSFASLSEHIYAVMKVIKYGKTVFWQHCPMYNKGANWLSLDKEIKNPYYGSSMLTCGSLTETIE